MMNDSKERLISNIENLINNNTKLDTLSTKGWTDLMVAVYKNDLSYVKKLISA